MEVGWSLPDSVADRVVTLLEPPWRVVVKHVNRELRSSVRRVEEATGHASELRSGDVCGGGAPLFRWALRQGCPWPPQDCMAVAAERGSLDVLQLGMELGYPRDTQVLQWLNAEGCPE